MLKAGRTMSVPPPPPQLRAARGAAPMRSLLTRDHWGDPTDIAGSPGQALESGGQKQMGTSFSFQPCRRVCGIVVIQRTLFVDGVCTLCSPFIKTNRVLQVAMRL